MIDAVIERCDLNGIDRGGTVHGSVLTRERVKFLDSQNRKQAATFAVDYLNRNIAMELEGVFERTYEFGELHVNRKGCTITVFVLWRNCDVMIVESSAGSDRAARNREFLEMRIRHP